jgi:hypothetical protein
MQYSKSEARRTGFDSANAMQQAKDQAIEAQLSHFMETVSTTHTEEINEIREENKTLTDLTEKFMGQMKTQQRLLDKMAKQLDTNTNKDRTPPIAGDQKDKENVPLQRQRHECPTCKIMCFHKKENCPETNEAKRWPGWTSRL